MGFEWDENKNQRNIEKHGIDFNDAKEVFKDERILKSRDLRQDYGEERWKAIGAIKTKPMGKAIINQAEAIRLLKQKSDISNYEVKFDDTQVEALDAILMGKNGIAVPDSLIRYDDETIDFSDDPDLTDEDLASGKIKWVVSTELTLDEEIKDWVKKENINLSDLLSNLITNFYRNVKSLPGNKM